MKSTPTFQVERLRLQPRRPQPRSHSGPAGCRAVAPKQWAEGAGWLAGAPGAQHWLGWPVPPQQFWVLGGAWPRDTVLARKEAGPSQGEVDLQTQSCTAHTPPRGTLAATAATAGPIKGPGALV